MSAGSGHVADVNSGIERPVSAGLDGVSYTKAPIPGHLGLRKRKIEDTGNKRHEGGDSFLVKKHCSKRVSFSGNRSHSNQHISELEEQEFELMEVDVYHEESELDSKL